MLSHVKHIVGKLWLLVIIKVLFPFLKIASLDRTNHPSYSPLPLPPFTTRLPRRAFNQHASPRLATYTIQLTPVSLLSPITSMKFLFQEIPKTALLQKPGCIILYSSLITLI